MTWQPRTARSVFLLSAGAFVALTAAVVLLGVPSADVALRNAMLAAAAPSVISLLRVSNLGGSWVVILPAMLLLFVGLERDAWRGDARPATVARDLAARMRRRWWIWAGAVGAAPLAETIFKHAVARARPEAVSLGFPSGHATAAAAFFGAVIYLVAPLPPWARRLARGAAGVAIVLVATARVVLRAHWPSDALAGIALGLALASAAAIMTGAQPPGAVGRGPARRPSS